MKAIAGGTPMEDAILMNRQAHSGGFAYADATSELLVTSGDEIRIWDIWNDDLVWDLGPQYRSQVRFNDTGTAVYYETEGNGFARFPLSPDAIVAAARDRVTRSFTEEECLRFLETSRCDGCHGAVSRRALRYPSPHTSPTAHLLSLGRQADS